jgi:hypothetical protein
MVMKNVIVYKEPGRFGGWTANSCIYLWSDEILIDIEQAYYQANKQSHSIVVDPTYFLNRRGKCYKQL